MYLPRLRTMTEIVAYFKDYDSNSVITETLIKDLIKKNKIHSKFVGSKYLVNLDECLAFFCNYPKIKINCNKNPRHMQSTGEIYRLFLKYDNATRIRKSVVRSLISSTTTVHTVWLNKGQWLIDLDEFVSCFTGGYECQLHTYIPRIRHYEMCYHQLKIDCPDISVTWNELHDFVHSGKVFCYWYNNRWLVDYKAIVEHFRGEK